MDFGERKSRLCESRAMNFQGIRSRFILAVTLHRAHLAQCTCLPSARTLRCRVSRSGCNPRETACAFPAPLLDPNRRGRDQTRNPTRLSRSPFRGRISSRQFRRESNLPKQRYPTWLHANAGVKFDSTKLVSRLPLKFQGIALLVKISRWFSEEKFWR